MHNFKQFIIEAFIDQTRFYWATDADLPDGFEFVAGSGETRRLNPSMAALEALYDRVRTTINPELPSRVGALFLAKNEGQGHRWKSMLRKKNLYMVELLSGRPYLTDADRWGDSLHQMTRPVRMQNWKPDREQSYYDNLSKGGEPGDEFESWRKGAEGDATTYWNSGNQWSSAGGYGEPVEFDLEDIETPEVIVAKGSKLKIIGKA